MKAYLKLYAVNLSLYWMPEIIHPGALESLNDMLPRFFERIERDYHEVRRRGSHHAAWVEHKRYLRALAETNRNLVLHAEWTALVWVDVPTSEIARRWRHPRLPRWGQPDKLVAMAVRRFADSIGLTLVN